MLRFNNVSDIETEILMFLKSVWRSFIGSSMVLQGLFICFTRRGFCVLCAVNIIKGSPVEHFTCRSVLKVHVSSLRAYFEGPVCFSGCSRVNIMLWLYALYNTTPHKIRKMNHYYEQCENDVM